ncbi:molybdopterin/thiamine biosynthesis adenylyltransferase [Sulfitobacter undariae]|uniref:Molybdopterin-synthase adenylyltransferase n=1 Tax=Sulfitobacter undariae TaxID=1563671 RepID=A0A7W6E4W4_9RHOB|nr:molybdopterin-synthase adenylyltransferase MoeB [Sulfitobacter undariae]MBB3994765.1 molybdopterin/thiamine biosynthesis adenylyltransferase [Sulfitobacter undariae]
MLVVFLIVVIWGLGVVFHIPRVLRWRLIGLLLLGVIVAHLILPDGNTLRTAIGGDAVLWMIAVGAGALVWAYSQVIVILRKRSGLEAEKQSMPANKQGSFSEAELNRYARHIVLREVGGAGQKALKNAKVLVVGAGGLGAPALQYLAAAGVGTIGVIDADTVENTNLHRQVIHKDASIGMAKVFSAQAEMQAQNPFVTVRPYNRKLDDTVAAELIAEYDLVLDGTDNFETRYLVNATCVAAGIPLISGALSQWEGQLSVFDPAHGAPCYQCIFPQAPAPHLAPSCAEAGVIGPLPGVVGAMMAMEAVKVITGAGAPLRGQMVIYDALYAENRTIRIAPRSDCPICASRHA